MGFLEAGPIDTGDVGDALSGPIVAMVSVQGPLRRRGLERRVTGTDQTILFEGDVLMTFLALMPLIILAVFVIPAIFRWLWSHLLAGVSVTVLGGLAV